MQPYSKVKSFDVETSQAQEAAQRVHDEQLKRGVSHPPTRVRARIQSAYADPRVNGDCVGYPCRMDSHHKQAFHHGAGSLRDPYPARSWLLHDCLGE